MAISPPLPSTALEPCSGTATTQRHRVTERGRRRAAAVVPALPSGRYLVVDEGDEILFLPVGGQTTRIGRSARSDIQLDDSTVSRRHALLVDRGSHMAVLDDRSTNGLHVNGDRVDEAVLQHGDALDLGSVSLRYLELA